MTKGDRIKTTIWVVVIMGVVLGAMRLYGYVTEVMRQRALTECFKQVVATAPDDSHGILGLIECSKKYPAPVDPRLTRCMQAVTARDYAEFTLESEKCLDKYLGPPPHPERQQRDHGD
jgi:hypothetical protein